MKFYTETYNLTNKTLMISNIHSFIDVKLSGAEVEMFRLN